jgi:hypothetical protein
MPAPAEEHLIKILKVAVSTMRDRRLTQEDGLYKFILNELLGGLFEESGVNLTSKAAELIQMAIDDLEAVQFEIEAELGSFNTKAEDWGDSTREHVLRMAEK